MHSVTPHQMGLFYHGVERSPYQHIFDKTLRGHQNIPDPGWNRTPSIQLAATHFNAGLDTCSGSWKPASYRGSPESKKV
jgi:hypothetical protein